MEDLASDVESAGRNAEQAPLSSVLLYTHNTTNAFNEGDPRIEEQFRRLVAANPDAGFLSEAYLCQNASDDYLQNVVLKRFNDLGYKAVVFDYSEDGRPDRHGGIMFARREMYRSHTAVELQGRDDRRALQMTLCSLSGEEFNVVGLHANDKHGQRVAETEELLHTVRKLSADTPLVVLGDLNSDARKNILKWGFRAAGEAASRIGPLARMAAEQESGRRTSQSRRIASLAIRSFFQMSGDTIQRLLGSDLRLENANTRHQLTSLIPKSVPAFVRRMQERWPRLNQPWIEADYILVSRLDNLRLRNFMRFQRLTDDEHLAISVQLQFLELATA